MKNIIVLLLAFIAYANVGFCQEKGLFYEISGNGLVAPSYLFGTIHLICEEDFYLGQQVLEKVKSSQNLVLEINLDDPNMMQVVFSNINNPSGEKITDYLNDDQFDATQAFLKENASVDINMMKSMRPFMLLSMLYPKILDCETKAYELELMKIAKQNEISIRGLESIEDQLAVFENIPLEEQYKNLYDYVLDFEKGRRDFLQLIETYRSKDIERMVEMVSESPEYKNYQGILLDDRNHNWLSPMMAMMKEGNMFFAVGAGHLGGENGMVNLLRKEGYTVTVLEE
ncbi:TraB/GumN family protein [Anditalea andensis]|uniref:Polysaccharide biosynthesis protein GumN n=1 Tax=Anditalea andensis TaxID=1048983 RepID=A0A074LGE3_9BACT|nr:TraB/GumN family protein [Anditalea andensis]KEO72862.1 polysaccharide biosynthesis protein GumN [Anditalea andensis]